jgi:amino acid adenylation domain-containing protein
MQSVWGILLGRYNNTNDVVFGSVVSGRPSVLKGVQEIVGLFINTVPQRIKFQPETRFGDLLLNVQQSFIAGEPYHHMNLAEVQSLSEIGSGLLDHLMVFENYPRSEKPLGNKENIEGLLEFEVGSIDAFEQVNYDFSVMILPGKELLVKFKYNGESYSEPFIGRLESQFKLILNNLVENPDMLIREIPLLSEDDKKKIEVFNNTDSPYEQSLCIHHKFELQANINPELPALITKERTLSYKDLNEHANRMANYLISKELKVEDIVGICIDRSIEMMIGIFGILKTGAAYLPLSPENPTDRLRSIINDAKPKLILSGKESAMNIPEESTVVYIDNILQEPLSANSSNPEVEMSSKNLAYVLYTSGSTGTPKGVMIEHHSVLNRLGWMQKAYPIGATDTLIQKTPITFDVSVWELFWWSFNGSKLVLLPKGGERDPETMIDYIDYFKVTTMHFVPSMFATFFETIVTRKLLDKLECMNRIFLSGEALPSTLVRDFNVMRKEFSLPDLINLYGPTEATVDVSYYNCPKENIENIYIGKPIDNTKLFVVNKLNEIQPIGISGELLITGVNLARGYMNRPDLTAEKFFDFRLSDGKSIKAYHTGDLVKLTSEGELDYLGRMDNQIKIRGFRIELGDIEAQISEHPMVSNVAVIMSENGQNKLLLAYVCLKPGCELEADKLRKYLNGKLPEYMVPSFIIFLDILPLTSSGKLDRKSLPAPDRIIERNELATPSNKNEKILLDLWKDILKIENLSINDNFFDVGGNSLSAISLANLISKEFNITLKVLMVFEFPNIKSQSEYLSGEKGKKYSLTNDDIDEKSKSKRKIDYKRFKR